MKGIKMWGVFILFVCALLFAAYGLYTYTNAETNDYAKVLAQVKELNQEIGKLKFDLGAIDLRDINKKIYDLQKECDQNAEDMKQNHEHLTKVREQQYLINERDNSAKVMNVRMEKPLEISIIEKEKPKVTAPQTLHEKYSIGPTGQATRRTKPSPKKVFKKVKSQLKELSR